MMCHLTIYMWVASKRHGLWKAVYGVRCGEKSPHNVSTRPRGKQTVNRDELTAVILSVRKDQLGILVKQQKLVVHIDNKYFICIYVSNSIQKWSMVGQEEVNS